MKFELKGIDKVITSFNRVDKKLAKQVDAALQGAALRTVAIAKSRLQPLPDDPSDIATDIGAVRQSINHTYDAGTKSARIFAGNTQGDHMAAYLEFGTGKYAAKYVSKLPIPFQVLAKTFYVNGKGRLREHPFLIPSYIQESQRLKEKIKKLKVSW